MRIVGIVGIVDLKRKRDSLWQRLEVAFKDSFPDARFECLHVFYLPWQGKRMREYAQAIVENYDDGEDTILLGYSMGGVIASVIASRFTKSRVKLIITIESPHRFKMFYQLLGSSKYPTHDTIPLISFGALFDIFVPWFVSKHPHAVEHHKLYGDHLFWFIMSKRPATIIAHRAYEVLKDPQHVR
jgi:pimeloyl-ACP methyl ester carboxylesterase